VQAFVGVEQCLFGEQGKPLRFQLRGRHGALSLRQRAAYVPNWCSYSGLGTLHIAKQRSQRMYNT
jgi:hypothetical protein